MRENEVSKVIVAAAIEVHRTLGGPGLMESNYEEALTEELQMRGLRIDGELPVPIVYKERTLRHPLR
jgi:GxxExxY protein